MSTALFFGGLAFQGCKPEERKSAVLAQVGNATLTLDDLRESFPAEYEQLIRRDQYLDFIKRWIDDEVIFQQAQRVRLDEDPQIRRKVERMRRKLLIEEFLSRENASEVFEPDEMAMNQYYEMHKEEFRRKVPEFKYATIRVQTFKQAQDVRNHLAGENFLAQSAAHSLDPTPESMASIGFKKLTEIPPCLAQDVASTRIGAVTLPIACPDGMYLAKVVERQESGSVIPFPEAKEEISGTLIMERKDKLMEERIAKYKEGMAISYNLDQIPGLAENASGSKETPENAAPATGDNAGAIVPAAATPAASASSAPGAAPKAAPKPALAASKPPVTPTRPLSAAKAPAAAAKLPGAGQPPFPEVSTPDPRLPREPWEAAPDAPAAPPKPKPLRRRIRRPDSTGAPVPHPAGDSAGADAGRPAQQEKTNVQTTDE